VATSDPVFMKRFHLQPVPKGEDHPKWPYELGKAWLAETNSGQFRRWEDVKFVRDNWDGPLVLKGIQSVADAEKAIEIGVQGIVVSNHGRPIFPYLYLIHLHAQILILYFANPILTLFLIPFPRW